jgi:amino-acid N-acetyltransferase
VLLGRRWPRRAEVLAAADLPTEDLGEGGRYFALVGDGAVVGYGGIEGAGPDQLLRSVVTPPTARGRGHGIPLVEALCGQARSEGAARLWLLTTTADGFFARLGWSVRPRAEAPAAIAASREFASLCPDTAVLMCRTLA